MDFDLNTIKNFSVSIYGDLEPVSEVTSKARVRIFYKGLNRNGSYITDTFAQSLIETLPYAPVKGIYDTASEDFLDHGSQRTQGRAYGVVMGPADLGFAWEWHVDEDGVSREYACANVLLWTGIYEEAKNICGKSQSMELYEPSIEGMLTMHDGIRCFEFSKAQFLGLQILGNDTEPCFEGSAFYSLYDSCKELVEYIKNYNLKSELIKEEHSKMPKIDFGFAENDKVNQIFDLLNPDFSEEKNWIMNYSIVEVNDDFVIYFDNLNNKFMRADYSNNDDILSLNEERSEFSYDSYDDAAREAINAMYSRNGDTFDNLNDNFIEVSTYNALKEENTSKLTEYENTISTLNIEKDELNAKFSTLSEQFNNLNKDYEQLKEFKHSIETANKLEMINKYAELIDVQKLDQYSQNVDNYSIDNLEKELAFELVKSNPHVFSKNPEPLKVPKDEPKSGIEEILSKYKN